MNIQHNFLLHETSIEILRLINVCESAGDQWGINFFSSMYNSIATEIASTKLPEANEPITEDERNRLLDEMFAPDTTDYTLISDLQIGVDGILTFTPENQ